MIKATRTLHLGDLSPLFRLPDQDGEMCYVRDLAGQPVMLVFYASDTLQPCVDIALALKNWLPQFEALNIRVMAISADSERLAFFKTHAIPYPLFCDPLMETGRIYGVCQEAAQEGQVGLSVIRTAIVLDANLRLIHIEGPITDPEEQFKTVHSRLAELLKPEEPKVIETQAPVLLIPNVLEPEFCQELMDVWATEGHVDSGFMRKDPEDPNKTIGVIDYGMKVRKDHFIKDDNLLTRLDSRMKRRIFPEILKCFNYECSRREEYKIACYEADPGGYFRKHRDNTTGGTAHRTWAMSLNLNADDYEGGYLRFPEYGPHLYKPGTGSAIIFSCSMMHEATDILSGQRFVLLNFFYGEKEAETRRQYEEAHNGGTYETIRLSEPAV